MNTINKNENMGQYERIKIKMKKMVRQEERK